VVEVRPTIAEAGGGALPGVELPSWGVAIRSTDASVETWERRLRVARPPVFCRIADDRLIFDLRTLGSSDWPALEAVLKSAASGAGP
jgi:L-seryl-tRNA(Ser) seleniumtransferase